MDRPSTRFTITYHLPNGTKESRVTPFMASPGHALVWIYQLKPWVIRQLGDGLVIRPWKRDDPR